LTSPTYPSLFSRIPPSAAELVSLRPPGELPAYIPPVPHKPWIPEAFSPLTLSFRFIFHIRDPRARSRLTPPLLEMSYSTDSWLLLPLSFIIRILASRLLDILVRGSDSPRDAAPPSFTLVSKYLLNRLFPRLHLQPSSPSSPCSLPLRAPMPLALSPPNLTRVH